MAVYICGDRHGEFNELLTFANRMQLGINDCIIVLGDMGLFWRHDKRDAKSFINFFEENYKFNLYFIDRESRKL